tara:strand:- start:644 stop:907 length:264 start_codon:yes stop_codon:yes gene_type:complete
MAKKPINMAMDSPQLINFDGKSYDISTLTDRAAECFNMLVRLQTDWTEAQYEVKKVETAQQKIVGDLKVIMVEDNIKPTKESEIVTQ